MHNVTLDRIKMILYTLDWPEALLYPLKTQIPDYLPSVSETTGDYQPGQFITRLTVSFTLFPCVVDALLYYHRFATQAPNMFEQKWWYQWLNQINFLIVIIKLFCLYTVTFIGLSENEGNKLHPIYDKELGSLQN